MTRLPGAYRRLQAAVIVSNVGDGAFAAAVPLLAVTLTRDPRPVALVAAAAALPSLLLSLPVGALVDRHDRAVLMRRAQLGQAGVAAVLAVAVAAGAASIPVLAMGAFALGAGEVVVAGAAQAILPGLVPAGGLHRANGQQFAATTTARTFAGPPAGSLLFAVGAALPFGLDAVSFAISAALVRRLPRQPPPSAAPLGRAMGEGLRWLGGHPLLRTLGVVLAVNLFCFQLANVTLVLLATSELHLGVRGYGLLLAAGALGGIAGGLVNHRILRRLGTRAAVLLALGGAVPAYLLVGAGHDPYAVGLLLGVIGFCSSMWNMATVSLRQALVPAAMAGRVNAVYRMVGQGLTPLGALAGGLVAHKIGVRAAYPVAGLLRWIVLVVAVRAILLLPVDGVRVRQRDRSSD